MPLFSHDSAFAHAKDRIECRASIRHGSRTFFGASLLLPARVREPAYGLYAFCRLSDDAIDLNGGSVAALLRLEDRVACIYNGTPAPYAADRVMADIVRHFAIPRALLEALLEGLAWDTRSRRYEDLSDLLDYAARVAGTVGVMMTLIMGVRAPEALARACDLGIAMQLSNIARDVGEDARAGRLYLPLRWLREAGIEPERFLENPVMSDALRGVISRLLTEAGRLYDRARRGIACLPLSCRPAILSAAMLYAEIGHELENLSYDSIAHRARVSGARKLQLLIRALTQAPSLKDEALLPPLPAVCFLIDAVTASPVPIAQPVLGQATQHHVKPQFLRVLAIFERLERNERCQAVFPRH